MSINRPAFPVVVAALLAGAVALPAAQLAGDAVPVPFSDPGRPGTVRVQMMNGSIIVRGENRKDVLVTSQTGVDDDRGRRRGRAADQSAGLTRITQGAGLTITEENNQISLVNNNMSRGGDVEVRVPTRTNLNLRGMNGQEIVVENVEGEIEVNHLNGSVRVTNVAGSVVAQSQNGNVTAVLTRLTSDKAMSFISFNGNVDVTLPATAKANLKMRSDNGDIFTDFDIQIRQSPQPQPSRSGNRFRIEVNQQVTGAINGGGPEFELRTFNGNIFLRRGAQQ